MMYEDIMIYEKKERKAVSKERLAEFIDRLPGKEKIVLSLYYSEDLTMKEIGEVLRTTESRVTRIHSEALGKIRAEIRQFGSCSYKV